ncbi:MAG: HDOD domain-containing protein [Thiobacillus sp.]|nr:HDOD domain-containing protein [Thiobacillus sp.]
MSETADTPRIQAILASGIKIPPLPEALLKIQAMLRNPDVSTADVARLIRQDGALSGAVFRVVGSPVFGLHARVDTVDRAVTLLGIPPTLAILRGISLRAAFGGGTQDAALEALWRRSGQIAQYAMAATRLLRPRGISPDQAYTLGMFHDCGLALLAKRFPAYGEALAQDLWREIPALDRAQNSDHGLVGEMVARNWQLPGEIAQAIRHHHEQKAADPFGVPARLVALLNFACHMCRQALQDDDQEWEKGWRDACAVRLGLTEPDLVGLEVEVGVAVATTRQ